MKLNILIYILGLVLLTGCLGDKEATKSEALGSVSISEPMALTDTSIQYTVTYKNAREITLTSLNVELIKTGTVSAQVAVTGDGLSTRTVTVHSITGIGTIAIKLPAGTASYSKTKKAAATSATTAFTVENLAPAITISAPSALITKNGPVTFTVTYSGASLVYLDETYISLLTSGSATGTVVVTGSGPTSRVVTISGITGSGTLGFQIAADSAISLAGKYSVATISPEFTNVDVTPPSATISAPSSAVSKSGPVSFVVTYSDSPTITLTAADVTLNKTGTADGVVSVTGTGSVTRTVTVSSVTGDGTIGISLAAGTAVDSVGNTTIAQGPSATFTADNLPPVATISAPSLITSNTGPVTYTVSYTGASSVSLSAATVTLNKTGTANGVLAVTGSGTASRTITITGITGDGTLGITVAAGTALDSVGNIAVAPAASATFAVDNTGSGITFSAPSLADTNTGPVTYTATFTDAVSISLTDSDVQIVKTGTANAVAAVSGAGVVNRTITLNSITGDGTLAVKLNAGTAIDTSGNLALASGNSPVFNVDNTRPTISFSAASSATTAAGPITYTVTYAGASAITLADADIVLNKTGTADATSAVVSGSGSTTRTVTISGISGNGTIGFSINAGTATDAAGNTALASAASGVFTVDNIGPTVAFGTPSKEALASGSFTIAANYTGASSITLTNANVSLVATGTATATIAVTGSGSSSRTITLSGVSGNGTLGISMVAATAVDSAGNSASAPANSALVYVTNDPLFYQSWHLYNTAQTAFSTGAGVSGIDLNSTTTWINNYKGSGVKILVSDSGVESAHEDLAANFLGGTVSHDYVNGSSPDWLFATGEPDLTGEGESHGTAVAGIIAAVAGNSLGGQGVAPAAKISSANILASPSLTTAEILTQADSYFDIINQSWGITQCIVGAPIAAYEAKLQTDRKVYVKSAGNDFTINMSSCGGSAVNRHGNSVFDYFNNNPYTIVVAAVNASGVKSSYSSTGSNIWISGFGGEYGFDSPALLTTDLSGCTKGMSPNDTFNVFQLASHPLNTNCNYTAIMNGTSAAAPTVSGVIALLLSANPALTARDIKHIIASTATKVQPTAGSTSNSYVASPTSHVYQQGWVTNAAGFNFHNYYGFGLINTDAAVTMATSAYSTMAAEAQTGFLTSAAAAVAIPDGSATGVEKSLSVASSYVIEGVQIKVAVTHANIGQLGIEVTSPSGTKSIVVNVNSSIEGLANLSSEVFLTNAFYGENSAGVWKVKVIDGKTGTTGTYTSFQINVIGH